MAAPSLDQVVEMALEYFAATGIEVSVGDDGIRTADGRIFGLEPLRRRLGTVSVGEWADAVDHHFSLLLGADPDVPERFEEAAAGLRSAVVAEADLGLFEGALVERKLVDGLGERLMLKKGPLGITVSADALARWDTAPARVWAKARSGSLWDEPVERHEIRVGPRTRFGAIRGGRWTSTHVLAIDRILKKPTEYGALVAVPARDEVLFHQIENESFADAALAMLSFAGSSYAESPLPIGCDLYWWSPPGLKRICRPGRERYEYVRVPEFSAMLWRLEETLMRSTSSRGGGETQ